MKIKIKPSFLVVPFLLIGINTKLNAQTTSSVSFGLQDCIDYAYLNQSKIKNAELDVELARLKVWETTGLGLPQVSANANLQDFIERPTTLLPGEFVNKPGTTVPVQFGTKYNLGMSLEVSQLIFDGNYLMGLKASSVYQDISKKSLDRTKIETAVGVTKAYYTALITMERFEFLESNISRIKKLYEDTKAYYENGFIEKIERDRIEVVYNNLVIEKQKLERVKELTTVLLKFQMGMDLAQNIELKEKLSTLIIPNSDIDTSNFNPENRVEYSLLETVNKLNKLELKRNKVTYLPSLVGYGSFGRSGLSDQFSPLYDGSLTYFPTYLIGLKLSLPIFGGGAKYFRLQQAKLNVFKSENDLENIKHSLDLDQKSSYITFKGNVESLENQKRNMELAEEVFRQSKLKYEQGQSSNTDLINAQTALKEAQTNYLSSLFDALLAKTELDRSLGNIK